ncbi:MAG TPA: nuclease A inhibitor family protein [Pyrinomonadaceae bacterium]|nr:nuclease A inhibitor family protein [Pyrinomonadaceae bacterium]
MKSDEQIMAELKRIVAGLWFMSESDYPFEVFRWDGANEVSPQFVREAAGLGPDAAVRKFAPEEFFGRGMPARVWRAAEASGTPEPDHALLRALEESLDGLRVYQLGEINMPVYVVGRSVEGNWLGVSTRVVET